MSWLQWLDYSSAEREAVLTLLASRKDKGTIDEFGIGTIRDAIADHLFPGLSTIQTRAKYFLFVPWILRAMEERPFKGDPAAVLASRERELIGALQKDDSADKRGLIGSESGDGLKRFPSGIYWNGIKRQGIFQDGSSLAEYLDEISDLRRAARDDAGLESSGEPTMVEVRSWDPGLPPAEPDLLKRASLALNRAQATYLHDKVQGIRTASGRPCLLQWLLTDPMPDEVLSRLDRPWELIEEAGARLPDHLREELRDARLFSLLVEGITTLYYYFLAQDLADSGRVQLNDHRQAVEQWCGQIAEEASLLRSWTDGLDRFWSWIRLTAPRIDRDRPFVERWLSSLAEHGFEPRPDTVATEANRAFLLQRERTLKGGLARLVHDGPRNRWTVVVSGAALNYRWRTARQFVSDVSAGLSRG